MTWDYLPELDERMFIIARYLKGKTKGRVIVDLDCLEARLLKFIEHNFKQYIGNDVIARFPTFPKTTFYQIPDTELLPKLNKCDILLILGHGGYEIDHNEHESSTLTETAKKIIKKFTPKIVIYESIAKYQEIVKSIIPTNYTLTLEEKLNLGEGWLKQRRIFGYESN